MCVGLCNRNMFQPGAPEAGNESRENRAQQRAAVHAHGGPAAVLPAQASAFSLFSQIACPDFSRVYTHICSPASAALNTTAQQLYPDALRPFASAVPRDGDGGRSVGRGSGKRGGKGWGDLRKVATPGSPARDARCTR